MGSSERYLVDWYKTAEFCILYNFSFEREREKGREKGREREREMEGQ